MNATLRTTALTLLLALQALAALAQSAGRIDFATGIVRIERGAQVLAGLRGTEVLEGDVVVTGPDTQVQIRMADDAFLALRPNSRLALERYRAGADENVVLSLAHGILRAFTGAIAERNRDRFVMKTPLATVGIRGSGNILAHLGAEGTVNHTITGAHSITAFDELGRPVTVVTRPGQTVQVRPGAPPRFVPTPAFIFAAASSAPPAQVAATSTSTTSGSSGSSSGSGGGGDSSGGASTSGGSGTAGPGGGDTSTAGSAGSSGSSSASGSPGSSGPSGTGSSSGGAASLPGGTGASTGSSSSPSSNVQTAVAPTNVRTPGGGGSDTGGGLSIALAGNLVNPSGGRAGMFATDLDPGYSSVTLDASGFLRSANNLSYSYPPGADPVATFPGGTFTDATVQVTGAPGDYFRNVEQNITLGRLQGATIDITGLDCSCGVPDSRTDTTGGGALVFVAYDETPRGVILSYTGTTDFRLDGATRPADSHGNLGTLNSASMRANFTDRTLDFTFNLSVNNLVYTASAGNVSFDGVRFNTGNRDGSPTAPLAIGCSGGGCAPSYRAAVNGSFAGSGTTAWLAYHIFPADLGDLVNGAIAFSALTAPLPRFALPATGTWNMVMVDNYIGTGAGFPTFNTSASAQVNFSTRRADFTFNLDRVLTPADVQAGFQPQSITASAANLPMQGVGFAAQTGVGTRPNNLSVTCSGCGTAPPVGRFEGYLSYVDPSSTGGNVNIYWYLTNNTSGTLGYDYNGSTYFGNAPAPARGAAMPAASLAPVQLARLPDVLRGPQRPPR
jgi:hypothetical protein